jgi:hypothetical protein
VIVSDIDKCLADHGEELWIYLLVGFPDLLLRDKDISGINVGTVKLFRVGKNSRVAVGAHLLDDGVHTPLVLPVGVRAAL